MRYVLGIESSCDETAAAIVAEDGSVAAHVLASQFDAHAKYGGVVPEIAARAHIGALYPVVDQCFTQSGISRAQISGVAATTGPGLIGGVMVGAVAGKAIALGLQVPFIAINHLEAHALVVRQAQAVAFPYLLLLVSGGHCQIVWMQSLGHYRVLGRTRDDALGEAFDKCAKMMGLGFPGGPAMERAALTGDAKAFMFPKPMHGTSHADFSFSGLKTAVRMKIEGLSAENGTFPKARIADIAASFQLAACESVVDRLRVALALCDTFPETLVVAGGVAANHALRSALQVWCASRGLALAVAEPALCTDNGVMIAWAGVERLRAGLFDGLDAEIRARWPLHETTKHNA